MKNEFKAKFNFETRKAESKRIKEKYEDRFPIIITKANNCTMKKIDKNKFLVPGDLSIGQILYVVRRRLTLGAEEAIFLFVNNNVLAASSQTIATVYESHADEDGFLYMTYCNENVFG
jgi:GABA(A) receptor-associated protein